MTNNIDWNKPVQTKDGRKVRLLCTDGPDCQYPVIGIIEGDIYPSYWMTDGNYMSTRAEDRRILINAPEKHELWVNVWKGPEGTILLFNFLSKKDADADADVTGRSTLVARIHREFEEGEGL
ncbi:hypothetical protein CHELA1G11_13012 [Hyphomicrobiales bacterium]|nr:hypothetical protein CHELA1G2_11298 [Hyphomicrobiales bacterium]CAH1668688.1 hypothetical protein CHELA1G11_13012 [Hyphomicrobiales bacterium]